MAAINLLHTCRSDSNFLEVWLNIPKKQTQERDLEYFLYLVNTHTQPCRICSFSRTYNLKTAHSALNRNFDLSVNYITSFCFFLYVIFYVCVGKSLCACMCFIFITIFEYYSGSRSLPILPTPFFFIVFFPKYESLIKINIWLKSTVIIWTGDKTENFTLNSQFQRSGLIICPNRTGGPWLLSDPAFKGIQFDKQKLKWNISNFCTDSQGNTKGCME